MVEILGIDLTAFGESFKGIFEFLNAEQLLGYEGKILTFASGIIPKTYLRWLIIVLVGLLITRVVTTVFVKKEDVPRGELFISYLLSMLILGSWAGKAITIVYAGILATAIFLAIKKGEINKKTFFDVTMLWVGSWFLFGDARTLLIWAPIAAVMMFFLSKKGREQTFGSRAERKEAGKIFGDPFVRRDRRLTKKLAKHARKEEDESQKDIENLGKEILSEGEHEGAIAGSLDDLAITISNMAKESSDITREEMSVLQGSERNSTSIEKVDKITDFEEQKFKIGKTSLDKTKKVLGILKQATQNLESTELGELDSAQKLHEAFDKKIDTLLKNKAFSELHSKLTSLKGSIKTSFGELRNGLERGKSVAKELESQEKNLINHFNNITEEEKKAKSLVSGFRKEHTKQRLNTLYHAGGISINIAVGLENTIRELSQILSKDYHEIKADNFKERAYDDIVNSLTNLNQAIATIGSEEDKKAALESIKEDAFIKKINKKEWWMKLVETNKLKGSYGKFQFAFKEISRYVGELKDMANQIVVLKQQAMKEIQNAGTKLSHAEQSMDAAYNNAWKEKRAS